MTPAQTEMLMAARQRGNWFQPVGHGWRTCDALVTLGYLAHNGAARQGGEQYRITTLGISHCPHGSTKFDPQRDNE